MAYALAKLKQRTKAVHPASQPEAVVFSELFKVDLDSALYYSGETIHGTASFTPLHQYKVGVISVQLMCVTKCVHVEENIVKGKADETGGEGTVTNEIHPYPREQELFKTEPMMLLDGRGVEGVEVTKAIKLPFSIKIPIGDYPSSLPESENTGYPNYPSSVRYFIRFVMEDIGRTVLVYKEVDVTVLSLLKYTNADVPFKAIEAVPLTSTNCLAWCSGDTGIFSFICSTDRSVFVPGETMSLTYHVATIEKYRKLLRRLKLYGTCQVIRRVAVLTEELPKGCGKLKERHYDEVILQKKINVTKELGTEHTFAITVPNYSPTCLPLDVPDTSSWKYLIKLEINLVSLSQEYSTTAMLPFTINGKTIGEISHLQYSVPKKEAPVRCLDEELTCESFDENVDKVIIV